MVAHLIDVGYVAGNAALIMSFTFGMMTVGKVSMGFLADRVSARVALMFNFAGQALGLVLALQVRHTIILPLFVLFFGLTLAPPLMLIPLLIAESLGLRRYGALTGITSIAATIGSTLGPLVAGRVFDVTHSYTSAFELFIVINVIGALVTFASTSYEKERSREKERPPMTASAEPEEFRANADLEAKVDLKAKA
jgi:MFS family permease